MMVPPVSVQGDMALDVDNGHKKERAWTLWSVWSQDIHDKLEVHFKSNHRMYSSLFIATMFRDKVSMTPLPTQLLNTEDENGVPGFLLLKVKEVGEMDLQKLSVQTEEIKYAENVKVVQPTRWTLDVHNQKRMASVLLDILKVEDYLIIFGGLIDPVAGSVKLDSENSAPCYVVIYRHDGIYAPTTAQKGQHSNPVSEAAINNMFFKGTAGEEVTFVQRIEPKSTKSTIWETVVFPTPEGNGERPVPVPGPSRPSRRSGRQAATQIKRERTGRFTAIKVERGGPRNIFPGAESDNDVPVDVVDISDDPEQPVVEVAPPPNQMEKPGDVVIDDADVIFDNVGQEQQEDDQESVSLPISQESVEDFPFPDLLQPLSKRSSLPPVSSEIPEVILYDDSDQETGDEAQNFIPIRNAEDERMSPDIFGVPDDEPADPPFATIDNEFMETDDGDTTAEVVVATKRKRNDSASSLHSESFQLIEQEVANLCKSSQSQDVTESQPQARAIEVDEDSSPDMAVAASSRTNARLLSQIPTVPRFLSQTKVLSQDVMVETQSQLFNDIQDLVSQEMHFEDEGPGSSGDAPQVRDVQNTENNSPAKHNSGTDSDSISSDDSAATALVTNRTSMKQLFELKGISRFHLLCKVHEFHEIPEKKQVILRVSDGTHIRFATRKGFPVAPGADVTLTLQVDILAQNCTDEFIRKVKLAKEMANEDIALSYVKVEKVKRKLFALTMNVAEGSDITFGESVEQEADEPEESPEKDQTRQGREKDQEKQKEAEQTTVPDNIPGPSSSQPGPSSKPGIFAKPLPPPTVSNPIGETPQVDPNAATGAKRRLTFDAPPAAETDEALDQELSKKFNLRGLDIAILPIKGIQVGKRIVLSDFYEENPHARVPEPQHQEQEASGSGPSTSKSKTVSKQAKKKARPGDQSNSDEDAEEVDKLMELSTKMSIPYSPAKKPIPKSKGKGKSRPGALSDTGSESEESDTSARKARKKPAKRTTAQSKSVEEVLSDASGRSEKSETSSVRNLKKKPAPGRGPVKKTRANGNVEKLVVDISSSSESEKSDTSTRKTKKKSVSPAMNPAAWGTDSESEKSDTSARKTRKKSASPTKKPDPKSKGKSRRGAFLEDSGSESEESDTSARKTRKKSVSPAKKPNPKSKGKSRRGAFLEDSGSESEESDTSARKTRKKSASASPAKRTTAKTKSVEEVLSDASERSEKSDTSSVRNLRKRAAPGRAPVRKTRANGKAAKDVVEISSESEKSDSSETVKQAKKRRRVFINRPTPNTKKTPAPRRTRSKK